MHHHQPPAPAVTFRAAECDWMASFIGVTSMLIGLLTLGYPDDSGLPYPRLWGMLHVVAGALALYAMRWRIKSYASAGALIAAFAAMRGLALAERIAGDHPGGGWRDGVAVVLWASYAVFVAWVWIRVIARHVAWNRLSDEEVHARHPGRAE